MLRFYMRPRDQKQGTTLVTFSDLRAFEKFVREVEGVEIVVPQSENREEPLTLLVD